MQCYEDIDLIVLLSPDTLVEILHTSLLEGFGGDEWQGAVERSEADFEFCLTALKLQTDGTLSWLTLDRLRGVDFPTMRMANRMISRSIMSLQTD